mgnify:CR=1 FL=1
MRAATILTRLDDEQVEAAAGALIDAGCESLRHPLLAFLCQSDAQNFALARSHKHSGRTTM